MKIIINMGISSSIIDKVLFLPPVGAEEIINTNISTLPCGLKYSYFRNANINDICLIYSHGNAENLNNNGYQEIFNNINNTTYTYSYCDPDTKQINTKTTGIDMIAYDYVGYGNSVITDTDMGITTTCVEARNYSPSVTNARRSIEAIFKFATSLGYTKFFFYGRSLGSGVTLDFLSKHKNDGSVILGVILESPMATCLEIAMPVKVSTVLKCIEPYNNRENIMSFASPLFIMHGTHDKVIPCNHSLDLYNLRKKFYRTALWSVKYKGHNDLATNLHFYRNVRSFLANCVTFHNYYECFTNPDNYSIPLVDADTDVTALGS